MNDLSRIHPPRSYVDPDALDYWGRTDDEWEPPHRFRLPVTPDERAALYGTGMVDQALNSDEKEAA